MKKMNLLEHFLLIELKRKMFYRLQDVLSSEFNIIQNIYELARLVQLKEDHYKRIDDAKSRRRSEADTTADTTTEIEMRAVVSKTMNITTISTSFNEKTSRSIT
jgi:hypothetical protein